MCNNHTTPKEIAQYIKTLTIFLNIKQYYGFFYRMSNYSISKTNVIPTILISITSLWVKLVLLLFVL